MEVGISLIIKVLAAVVICHRLYLVGKTLGRPFLAYKEFFTVGIIGNIISLIRDALYNIFVLVVLAVAFRLYCRLRFGVSTSKVIKAMIGDTLRYAIPYAGPFFVVTDIVHCIAN